MSEVVFSGVYAMVYAFFDQDGRLDRAAMRRQVEACLAAGAHGVAALGLATEVGKLTPDERFAIMDWVTTDVAGRVPVALTISGATVEAQIAEAQRASAAGATVLIHQPPPKASAPDDEALIAFFAGAMGGHGLPAALQNAPAYLGVGLSTAGLQALQRRCSRFRLLKGEGPAVEIAQTIAALGDHLAVFNGRGGLELPDNMRAGCAGVIVAPDVIDSLIAIVSAIRNHDDDEAERRYRDVLPAIVFVMQSIDTLTIYGKRLAAWRMALDVAYDRAPGLKPTAFGLAATRRLATALGPMRE